MLSFTQEIWNTDFCFGKLKISMETYGLIHFVYLGDMTQANIVESLLLSTILELVFNF